MSAVLHFYRLPTSFHICFRNEFDWSVYITAATSEYQRGQGMHDSCNTRILQLPCRNPYTTRLPDQPPLPQRMAATMVSSAKYPKSRGQSILLRRRPQWRSSRRHYLVDTIHRYDEPFIPPVGLHVQHHRHFMDTSFPLTHNSPTVLPSRALPLPQHIRDHTSFPRVDLHRTILDPTAPPHTSHIGIPASNCHSPHPQPHILESHTHHSPTYIPLAPHPPLDLYRACPLLARHPPLVPQPHPQIQLSLHLIQPTPRMAPLRYIPVASKRNLHGRFKRRRLDARNHRLCAHTSRPAIQPRYYTHTPYTREGGCEIDILHTPPPPRRHIISLPLAPAHPHPHNRVGHRSRSVVPARAPCVSIRSTRMGVPVPVADVRTTHAGSSEARGSRGGGVGYG
jgi:hypothetical protein